MAADLHVVQRAGKQPGHQLRITQICADLHQLKIRMRDQLTVEPHCIGEAGTPGLHNLLQVFGGKEHDHRVVGSQVAIGNCKQCRRHAQSGACIRHNCLSRAGAFEYRRFCTQKLRNHRAVDLMCGEKTFVGNFAFAGHGDVGNCRVSEEVV